MKRQTFDKDGKKEIELTKAERDRYAALGDQDAKQDLFQEEITAASTDVQKQLDAIKKYLGV